MSDADSIETLERAFASTCAEVDATAPDQLTLPTPCSEWDVRALVNHIIGGASWYADAVLDGVTQPIDEPDDDYVGAGDYCAAYTDEIRRALDAYRAPGALETTIAYVGRSLPGATVMRLCALDTFVHGWDLARALGRSTDLDPELADLLRGRMAHRVPEAFRGTGPDALYRPAADVPTDATAADRLAAALGRDVT
jgi:uncharacterized protein (TIGR03086 family)